MVNPERRCLVLEFKHPISPDAAGLLLDIARVNNLAVGTTKRMPEDDPVGRIVRNENVRQLAEEGKTDQLDALREDLVHQDTEHISVWEVFPDDAPQTSPHPAEGSIRWPAT